MDFSLSDEQKLLKESVDRLLAEKYDFNTRRKFSESKLGWSREMWNQYAELGLLGGSFSEAHGDSADKILVTARVSGNQRDRDGIGIFIVDGKAAGLTRKPMKLSDSHQGADIFLKGVKVGAEDVIGEVGRAYPLIERVLDRAI